MRVLKIAMANLLISLRKTGRHALLEMNPDAIQQLFNHREARHVYVDQL